jgi:two-component system, chemotaxis family, sensor kinase CheA
MPLDISKFLEQFFLEAEEKLARVQNFMVELEQNPRNTESLLAIQRDMHTIKGSARMVGLHEISTLAHRMEDVFTMLGGRGGVDAAGMDALYAAVDGLAAMVRAAREKEAGPDPAPLLEQLRRVLDGGGSDAGAGDSAPVPGEEGGRTEGAPKRFNLDFASLRHSVQTRRLEPSPAVPESRPAAPERVETGTETRIESGTETSPPRLEAESGGAGKAIPRAPDRPVLKVDGEKLETVINQVTDLLAKRYYFGHVLQMLRNLAQVNEGFQREWSLLRNRLAPAAQAPEAMANIENMFDLQSRSLIEFERVFRSNLGQFEGALRDIYDELLDLKMTPISAIFAVYPRFVRDYARQSGKKIRLFLRGGDNQMDKSVIERISEPLIHLLRNACDHGIESPEERRKAGKDPVGTIVIEASKKGSQVEIRIQDDGAGLDRDAIGQTAVRRGLISETQLAGLDDAEIFDFILETGFSTRREISDTSGRGIGMDIVKRTIGGLGGNLTISSVANHGSTFTLEFPVAVFTTKVMFVVDDGQTYAVPSGLIRQIVRLPAAAVKQKHDGLAVVYEGQIFSVARLARVLTGGGRDTSDGGCFMLLPKAGDRRIGLLVDSVLHENEVIIKELGPFLGKRRYVFGVIIDDRGRLLTVVDVNDILSAAIFSHRPQPPASFPVASGASLSGRRVLVVDDSLLVREMEKNVLEAAGFDVVTAINGLDGYNKAISDRFDLILADIEMPEMDGFELIEQVRKIKDYTEVPVIVLSTREREQDKVRGLRVGANAWLQKQNFDDREFLRVIRSFIG